MQPRWREDGHELYYLAPDGKMMVVEVSGGESLETSPPIVLFQTDLRPDPVVDQYDVTGDGQRFLIAKPVGAPTKPITAILNWMAGAPR